MDQLNWIDEQQDAMVQTLIEWCNVNSGSYHVEGVQKMADIVQQAFAPLADNIEVVQVEAEQTVDDGGQLQSRPLGPLLKITKRADAKHRVLMTGHLDTVFAKDHAFQTCKINEDGTLNGPGAADMKGGILVILKTLEAFEQTENASQIGWTVLLNPDEEIGSPGSRAILEQEAKQHSIGLVYEPSTTPEGALAGRRKGSGNFHFVIRGKSAHAGRAFNEGRNAIVASAKLISALDALNGQREEVTINIAKIRGGDVLNKVPDAVVLRVNIRTFIPEDQAWFLDQLPAQIKSCESDGIQIEQHGGFTRPPRLLEGPVLRLFEQVKVVASELNLNIEWIPTGGVCDGNNLVAAGLPTVDTLGVRGALIHTAEEYMCLESLSERAKLSLLLLNTCAQSGFNFLEE